MIFISSCSSTLVRRWGDDNPPELSQLNVEYSSAPCTARPCLQDVDNHPANQSFFALFQLTSTNMNRAAERNTGHILGPRPAFFSDTMDYVKSVDMSCWVNVKINQDLVNWNWTTSDSGTVCVINISSKLEENEFLGQIITFNLDQLFYPHLAPYELYKIQQREIFRDLAVKSWITVDC